MFSERIYVGTHLLLTVWVVNHIQKNPLGDCRKGILTSTEHIRYQRSYIFLIHAAFFVIYAVGYEEVDDCSGCTVNVALTMLVTPAAQANCLESVQKLRAGVALVETELTSIPTTANENLTIYQLL